MEPSHLSKIDRHQEPSTSLNKSVPGKSLMGSNNHDVLSSDKILKSTFDNIYQVCFKAQLLS